MKKYYCTECGTQNVTWCTGCMRGACCQPNPACYVCDGEPPPQLIPSTVDDISDEELRRPLDSEDKERQRVSMLTCRAAKTSPACAVSACTLGLARLSSRIASRNASSVVARCRLRLLHG